MRNVSSETNVQASDNDKLPPAELCLNAIRSPHVKVPPPSVTGVSQTDCVHSGQPQYWEDERDGPLVGSLLGLLEGDRLGCEIQG